MARRAKIAVSLSSEVLQLLDKHAAGRSRSRCVEDELLSALRRREWERLAAQMAPEEADEMLDWAATSFPVVDEHLARAEARTHARRRKR